MRRAGPLRTSEDWPLILLMPLIGLAGAALLLATTYFRLIPDPALSDLLTALGQGALGAAVIGGIVDYTARRRFAREVGQNVYMATLSRNAPKPYVQALERAVRFDWVMWSTATAVTFQQHRHGVLKLTIRYRATLENVSDRPQRNHDPWLMRSIDDSPGSRFLHYSSQYTRRDAAGSTVETGLPIDLTTRDLGKYEVANGEGSISVAFSRMDLPLIPPGAVQSYTIEAELYQWDTGVLPLVRAYPTLRQMLTLRGEALAGLTVMARGSRPLSAAVPTQADAPELLYTLEELALPGTVTLVHWQRRGAE